MRAAVLLQGDPRFCKEFDYFLENLKGFDQVDYFMYFWENNPPTAEILQNPGHIITSPFWQKVDKEAALKKFEELLPKHHKVVKLELGDQNSVMLHRVDKNFALETRQPNVSKMWFSQYKVNQLRLQYEIEHNVKYDAIIRTRPDVALMNEVHADQIVNLLKAYPNLMIMPRNKTCGYGVVISDLFGIANSETTNIISNLYYKAMELHSQGVIFHPETMLAKHLERNRCQYRSGPFNIEFRYFGIYKDLINGDEWEPVIVPTWYDKIYISNFGRWE